MDLSKAFDAINPRLLLAKLKAYGFSPHALDMMPTYLLVRQNVSDKKAYALTLKKSKLAFLTVHYWDRFCSTCSLMTSISVYLVSHCGCALMM